MPDIYRTHQQRARDFCHSTLAVLGLVGICGLGACERAPSPLPVPSLPPTASVQVEDSSGIWIALNTGGLWTQGDAWRIDSRPSLRLGEASGDPSLTFYGLSDASRSTDGRLAVVNRGSREIRLFSARGRHLRSIGREGDGPGEFRDPVRIEWLAGDSIAVWDQQRDILTIFDAEGEFGRSMIFPTDRPPLNRSGPRYHGRVLAPFDGYRDGRLIARAGTWYESVPGERWVLGYTELIEVRGDGSGVNSLGAFALGPSYFNEQGEQSVHFGPESRFAVNSERVYYTDGTQPQISAHDLSGRLLGYIRASIQVRPVGEEDIAELEAHALERVAESREGAAARWRELFAEIPSAKTIPVFGQLLLDSDGNIWVEEYPLPGERDPSWLVFRRDGQLFGRVLFPSVDQVFEIGDSWILAREVDDLGIERLVQHELRKPSL